MTVRRIRDVTGYQDLYGRARRSSAGRKLIRTDRVRRKGHFYSIPSYRLAQFTATHADVARRDLTVQGRLGNGTLGMDIQVEGSADIVLGIESQAKCRS